MTSVNITHKPSMQSFSVLQGSMPQGQSSSPKGVVAWVVALGIWDEHV